MKKWFLLLTMLVGFSANASLITVEIEDTVLSAGDSTTVNIIATDLDPFTDLEVFLNVDTSMFSVDLSSFVTDLYSFFFGDYVEAQLNSDGVGIVFFDLFPVDSDYLLIGSFTITALVDGIANFNLDGLLMGLDGDYTLTADTQSAAAKVSEPAAFGMLLFALLSMLLMRKRRS